MKKNCYILFVALILSLISNISTAQIRMHGVVTGRDQNIIGALLVVDDTEVVTLSDLTGHYSLKIPERYAGYKVVVSFPGYQNDTIPVVDGEYNFTLQFKEVQKLSEVMVSTQKRVQSNVDVPIAISVIDGARMQANDLSQIDEMSRVIPGFQNMIQGGNNAVYGIRSVSSDGVESYSVPRISVYMDGVSISRMQSSIIEPFDLSRVEVVKGPQGTLFGRGALVGAIHYIRNKPNPELRDGYLQLGYGAYNQRTAEGVVNTPLADGKMANRFGFRYDAHDGYIENKAGGKLNGKGAIALKNATLFDINDRHKVTLTLDYMYCKDPGVSFKSNKVALPDGGGDTSPFTSAYLNGGKDLKLTRNVYTAIGQYDFDINDGWSFSNTMSFRGFDSFETFDADGCYLDLLNGSSTSEGKQFSEEARLNWDKGGKFSGFVGTSFSYETNQHYYSFKGNLQNVFPAAVGPAMRQQMAAAPSQIAQQVTEGFAAGLKGAVPDELIASLSESLQETLQSNLMRGFDSWFAQQKWETTPNFANNAAAVVEESLAGFLSLLESTQYGPLVKGILNGASIEQFVKGTGIADIVREVPELKMVSNVPLPSDYEENMVDMCHTFEGDLFADVTWNISPKWYLIAGLRGTRESMRTGYSSMSQKAPILNSSIIYQTSDGENKWVDTTFDSWVGRLVLHWKFDETHNLYASVSKGRRPGVIYFDMSPRDVVRLQPERIINYELGIKGISKYGHFSYYVATYYYDWHNFQSSTYYNSEEGQVRLTNDDEGKASCIGMDGSLLYTFNDRLSMFMDYAFSHARFSDKDMEGKPQALSGKKFRLMPDHTFDLGFNWNRRLEHLASNPTVYCHPYFTYTSKIYFTEDNNEALAQKGYMLLNLNAGYTWKTRNQKHDIDLRLWGKNILNQKYLVDAGNAGDQIGFPTFVAGTPATFGVSARVNF